MDPVTIGMISMGVGGAIKVFGDLFGGSSQANLMRQQAQLKLDTLEENMRRTEGMQTQVLSSTKARMAGTGIDADSASFTDYIKGMATEFETANKKAREFGVRSADLMKQGADAAQLGGIFNAGADIFGATAGMAGLAAQK